VGAGRAYFRRKSIPVVVTLAVVGAALFAVPTIGLIAGPLVLLAAVGAFVWFQRRLWRSESAAQRLGHDLVARFQAGGDSADRARLTTIVERLAATFGLDAVSCFIIRDDVANAALLRSDGAYVLLVTDTLVRTFELIELEGVVAHLMARERLGLLDRRTMAVTIGVTNDAQRRDLAGVGQAFRADEVAAAAIRYPIGLSQALSRIASQHVPAGSYFASPAYDRERWVWFDAHCDGLALRDGDIDQADVRARALAEW
jgi:Zn-dependent protease with chaperone function